jgi:regulator of nucleoside diphosphate kinase
MKTIIGEKITRRPRSIFVTDADRRRIGTVIENAFGLSHHEFRNCDRLGDRLEHARSVDARAVPKDVVTMNSTIRLVDERTGDIKVKTLVYPQENGGGDRYVSVLSPLGMALLGRRAGDAIERTGDGRSVNLRVERVLYQPEAVGDFHR